MGPTLERAISGSDTEAARSHLGSQPTEGLAQLQMPTGIRAANLGELVTVMVIGKWSENPFLIDRLAHSWHRLRNV
jgi:hypothetical protein